jgi:acetolactate synthase-1/2/3 large subunit
VPQELIGTDAFQEVDTFGLSLPIVKHNYLVTSASDLLRIVPEAFAIASRGRPGPVLIDVPKDVQTERVTVMQWPDLAAPPATAPLDATAIERAAAMIEAAERPILYLGGGIVHSGAAAVARALAERSTLPTVMTLMGLGVVPTDHALSLGMLGMHGAPYTNLALDECDLLIAVGARFDDRATGKLAEFCPRAAVIHIDVDAAELNKLRRAELAIRADARTALDALLPRLAPRRRARWIACVTELKARHPLEMPGRESVRNPYGLIRAVAAALDDDAIITTDVGQHQMWVAQALPLRRARQWLTSGGLGTMGFGLPAAIGAALAEPTRKVVCFSGDGSILMNLQELATLADEQLDVKIVLLDNRSLGLVHQQQTLFYGQRVFASRYERAPDFCTLARGFGVAAVALEHAADPAAALAHALRQPGPMLVHAPIDAAEQVLPMVPPGAGNTAMIVRAAGSDVEGIVAA